jgi:tRNA threonylcarbamoyladenosine biosynthesis protein TsaB
MIWSGYSAAERKSTFADFRQSKIDLAHTEMDTKDLQHPVILALETATLCGSVAIVSPDGCLAEFSLQSGETHSRRLLAGIDWLLKETGINWQAIDAIAASQGPGSFTGLRIGLATAKGLALAGAKKLIGIGTLDGLAAQFFGAGEILLCPVLDARKKEVYCGFYKCDTHGIPRIQGQYMVISPELLSEKIDEPAVLLGDGARVYRDLFTKRLGDLIKAAPSGLFFPRAASIGLLALEKWQQAEFLDPSGAEPIYIRPSEAELNLGR